MKNPEPISKCCKAKLKVDTGDEGTSCYICTNCNNPSDPEPIKQEGLIDSFSKRFAIRLSELRSVDEITYYHLVSKELKSLLHGVEEEHKKEYKRFQEISFDAIKELQQQHKEEFEGLRMNQILPATTNAFSGYNEAVKEFNKKIDELLKQYE